VKLTAKSVATLTLPVGKSDVIHFDNELPGFGYRLRAGAGGKVLKSWVCQYRRAGATRRMLIGKAHVLNAEQARARARDILAMVQLGQDPQGDRADRRDADKFTLRKAVEEFLAFKQERLRPRSFIEVERYLTSGYFKPLHGLPLDVITRRDVSTRIVAIARESGNSTAARARNALSTLFVWAMRMGLVESNPVIGSAQPAENKPRERVLDDSELVAIWKACGDDDYGKIVKLLILTGCRRDEIGHMVWGEFAPDGTSWTLPAERSKNKRPLTLPMMPMMREIVDTVPRMVGRDQLFGERSPKGFVAWYLGKPTLDERSGVAGWQLRDTRRSVATRMADIGVQPHIIEAVLNHYSGHRAGVAGVYNKSPYANEVRNALATWHDHLRAIIEGGERKVVNFQPQQTAS
jgi:integrase